MAMEVGSPSRFAATARALATEARRLGLIAPSFRTPPRVAGLDRTVRGVGTAAPLVAVRLRGRPFPAVVADMVEGVVAANRLGPVDASQSRAALWAAVARLAAEERSAEIGTAA